VKRPVFPNIAYKVTLIGKHKSCQIWTIAKDIVLSFSLTQSSHISRKSQEHQEHFMAFGKGLIKTLRKGLARHEIN
jgi:hypothetical protein